MAKKIDRSRIDAGLFELPRKLGFLTESGVDYQSVTDRDGDWSVELSAGALQRLVKSKADLKALKAQQKTALASSASELAQERTAHEETRTALAKAERRIKAIEKKLASATQEPPGDAVRPATGAAGKRSSRAIGNAGSSSRKGSLAPAGGATSQPAEPEASSVSPELLPGKSASTEPRVTAADDAASDTGASEPASAAVGAQ